MNGNEIKLAESIYVRMITHYWEGGGLGEEISDECMREIASSAIQAAKAFTAELYAFVDHGETSLSAG